jgi:histidyl-tRNA synthetase
MQQGSIARVQGFHDLQGDRYRQFAGVLKSLTTSFRLHGYNMIDVPIVESLDLYLRKNGAQVLSKLYSFLDVDRREVALRPEFTASVIRAVASDVRAADPPCRVAYAGPVFRCEQGHGEEDRQFTQAGVELLGDRSATADAEVLTLACKAALAAGVPNVRLVIGHLGPLRALLAHVRANGRAEGYLLAYLEQRYRGDHDNETIRRRLGLQVQSVEAMADESVLQDQLADAVRDLTPAEARTLVRTMLDQMGLSLAGTTRTPDEIIDRVLLKSRRHASLGSAGEREDLERALDFAEQLSALRGLPNEVLPEAERLLARFEVPAEALEELREVLGLLAHHDLPNVTIELAPGMARGIAYYSGLIFELYADSGRKDSAVTPLCGGGRYDGLALALTGTHAFPALGFSFAVEVLQAAASSLRPPEAAQVVVLVAREGQRRRAHQLADRIRAGGLPTIVHNLSGSPDAASPRTPEQLDATALLVLPEQHDSQSMPAVIFKSAQESPRVAGVLREAWVDVYSVDRAPVPAGDRA